MKYLYHLSDRSSFDFDLSPPSLQLEGFVHLSAQHQVLKTADRWMSHCPTPRLLVLDAERLADKLVWEDTHGHGEEFPHYYAPLPADSIVAVGLLRRGTDGRCRWPDPLTSLICPLLDGPSEDPALIEPSRRFPQSPLPENCLLYCFGELPENAPAPDHIHRGLGSAIGAREVMIYGGVAVCRPGVGGPSAAATLEELIALGCRRFLLVGGAGSLVEGQKLGQLVLVDEAVRDEGLSHHYLSAAPTVCVPPDHLRRLQTRLSALGVEARRGTTWTTDALYRETPERLQKRRREGCLTVEMEVASLLAVAEFRGVELGALLFCGDDLSTDTWDFRDWTSAHTVMEKLFFLGLEVFTGPPN